MNHKLLIVDDDEDWLMILRENFESAGYDCTISTNVKSAKHFLLLDKPDLVISDYQMGMESGLHLLEYVSALYPDLPFILLTGYENNLLKSESISMGAYGCLWKSIEFAELIKSVSKAIPSKNIIQPQCPPDSTLRLQWQ